MVSNPVTCGPQDSLAEVDAMCRRYRISGLPVVDAAGRLQGIVTNRDMRFEEDRAVPVADIMTKAPAVTGHLGIDPGEALSPLRRHKIEKLPLVDEDNRVRGLITVKDHLKSEAFQTRRRTRRRLVVGLLWASAGLLQAGDDSGRGWC